MDDDEVEFEFRPAAKNIDVATRWEMIDKLHLSLQNIIHPDQHNSSDAPNVEEEFMMEAAKNVSKLFAHPRVIGKMKDGVEKMVHLFESCQLLLEYFYQANQRNSDDADRFYLENEKYERDVNLMKEEMKDLQKDSKQEADEYKRQIAELKKTLTEKNERVRIVERENDSISKKLSQLMSSLESNKEKTSLNQQEFEDEREDIISELRGYHERNRNLKLELESKHQEIDALTQKLNMINQESDAMREDLLQSILTLEQKNKMIPDLESRLERSYEELSQCKQVAEEYKSQYIDLKETHMEDVDKITKESEQRITELEQQTENFRVTEEELNAEIRELKEKNQIQETRIIELSKIETSPIDLTQRTIAEPETGTTSSQLDANDLEDVMKENQRLKSTIKKNQQNFDDMKEEIESYQQIITKKDAEILTLTSKLKGYEDGVDGLVEAQKEIRYLREQLEIRNIQIVEYKKQEQELRRKLNELLDKIEALKEMGINVNIDVASFRKLRESELLKELEKLKLENEDLLRQIADLRDQLTTLEDMRRMIQQYLDQIYALEDDNQEKNQEILQLREEIENLNVLLKNTDILDIENLKNELIEKVGKYEEQRQELEKQLAELNNRVGSLTNENNSLRRKVDDLSQELHGKEVSLGQLDNHHQNYKQHYESYKQLMEKLKTDIINEAHEREHVIEDKLVECLKELKDTADKLEKLHKELIWTRNELEQRREELEHHQLELALKTDTITKLEERILEADKIRDDMLTKISENTNEEPVPKKYRPIHERDVNIEDLEAELRTLHLQIADMMEKEAIMQKKVIKRDEEVRRLNEKLESMKDLQNDIQIKDAQIAELQLYLQQPTIGSQKPGPIEESHFPDAVKNVIKTFEELIKQKDIAIARYENQLEELRNQITECKSQCNEEIMKLQLKLQSKDDNVVNNFKDMLNRIELSTPEIVDSTGIPISQVDEMFVEKAKEIQEHILVRQQIGEELKQKELLLQEYREKISALEERYDSEVEQTKHKVNVLSKALIDERQLFEKERQTLMKEKLTLTQSLRERKHVPKTENKKTQQELVDLKNQNIQLEEAVKKLTESLIQSESTLGVRQKRDASEFDARVNKIVENRTEKLREEMTKLKEENEVLKLKKAPDREQDLRSQIEEMRKELEAKQKVLEKQFSTVKRLNNTKELLLKELNAFKRDSSGNSLRIQSRIEELEKRNKILEMNSNSFTRRENERLMKELSEERMKYNELKRRIEQIQESRVSTGTSSNQSYSPLQQEIERLRGEVKNQLEKTKALSNTNAKQVEEISKLQTEIRILNDTISKLKAQKPPPPIDNGLNVQQIARFTDNEAKLKRRIENIEKNNETKRKELEDVIESLKTVAENLQKENAVILKQSVSNVKFMEIVKEKRTLQKRLEALESDISTKKNTDGETESKLAKMLSNNHQMTEQNKKLREECEKQERKIQELKDENAVLTKKLDFLQMEMQELTTATAIKTEESVRVAKLLKETKKYKEEIGILKNQLHDNEEELEETRIEFEKIHASLEQRVQQLHAENEKMLKEKQKLQEEKSKLEEELSELDDGFFEEIENLKYQYFLAKEKLKQYEGKQ